MKPSLAQELSAVYLAKGAHASTAIEGNTLSEEAVLERVKGAPHSLPTSQEYLGIEVDNVIAAIRDIDAALQARVVLALDTGRLEELHEMVLRGLEDPPANEPGVLRRHDVGVRLYRAPDHNHVRPLLDGLFEWLQELEAPPGAGRADQFYSAVMRAILAHLYIAWIHPFGNGNGRSARLVEVQILAQSGLVPLVSTNLLSDHYNKTRGRYYEELQSASDKRDPTGFVSYAIQGLVEELRSQIAKVREHNTLVAWESYVHEVINRFPSTAAKRRQRILALAMPTTAYVSRDEVEVLSPQIAAGYAVAGERTLARDLNDLIKMGLLDKKGRGYRAPMEIIQAFMPPVAEPPERLFPDSD